MTRFNLRNKFRTATHLTASGLIKAGDAVADMQMPDTESFALGIKNIRRNIAQTIMPNHD